jgi:hypothetical protein
MRKQRDAVNSRAKREPRARWGWTEQLRDSGRTSHDRCLWLFIQSERGESVSGSRPRRQAVGGGGGGGGGRLRQRLGLGRRSSDFFLISAPLKFLFSKRWFCLHKLQKLVYKPAAAYFKLNIFLR